MKSILYSVFIGSLALALTAGGAQAAKDKDKRAERSTPQHRTATVPTAHPATTNRTISAQHHVAATLSRQRSYAKPRTTTSSAVNRASRSASTTPATARNSSVSRNRNVTANRDRNAAVNRKPVAATSSSQKIAGGGAAATSTKVLNRNVTVNRTTNAAYYRGPNVRVTNNWHGNAFRGPRYTAFRNYNRQWHDRNWWTSHYNRIVFVNNGWWYWNAGYWFPAWGYAPYVSFVFDGPIYGYNGLSPDQVTVNVQQQLANAGYYNGPIDGELGPMTREAIAAYQADNGLAVTSAIDEPTLATMGLV